MILSNDAHHKFAAAVNSQSSFLLKSPEVRQHPFLTYSGGNKLNTFMQPENINPKFRVISDINIFLRVWTLETATTLQSMLFFLGRRNLFFIPVDMLISNKTNIVTGQG